MAFGLGKMEVFEARLSRMKIQHLPIGARFEFDGQIFVKTGPMTAASEAGGQRVIPRYATLRALEAPVIEKAPKAGTVDRARVMAAFAEYEAICSGLLDEASKPKLEAARQAFLAALK